MSKNRDTLQEHNALLDALLVKIQGIVAQSKGVSATSYSLRKESNNDVDETESE